MKTCIECDEPFTARHGLRKTCSVACANARMKLTAVRRRTRDGLVVDMLSRAAARARKKGLEFRITADDVEVPDTCPVFDAPFILGDRNWTASLDRIDSRRGYVPGNVRVISNRANSIKSDATVAEIEALLGYMRRERFGL